MKLRQLIFFLSLGFCCSSLFAQQEGKEVYVDKINNFIISYPDDWNLENGDEGEITIYSPNDVEEEDENSEDQNYQGIEDKIQIIPSRWDEGNLEEFVNSNFLSSDWSSVFENFKIVKQGKEKINGNDAMWYMATYKLQDVQVTSLFYFIKMFNRVISFTSFCKSDDFELNYKIKYLEIIRSTKSNIDSKKSKLR